MGIEFHGTSLGLTCTCSCCHPKGLETTPFIEHNSTENSNHSHSLVGSRLRIVIRSFTVAPLSLSLSSPLALLSPPLSAPLPRFPFPPRVILFFSSFPPLSSFLTSFSPEYLSSFSETRCFLSLQSLPPYQSACASRRYTLGLPVLLLAPICNLPRCSLPPVCHPPRCVAWSCMLCYPPRHVASLPAIVCGSVVGDGQTVNNDPVMGTAPHAVLIVQSIWDPATGEIETSWRSHYALRSSRSDGWGSGAPELFGGKINLHTTPRAT